MPIIELVTSLTQCEIVIFKLFLLWRVTRQTAFVVVAFVRSQWGHTSFLKKSYFHFLNIAINQELANFLSLKDIFFFLNKEQDFKRYLEHSKWELLPSDHSGQLFHTFYYISSTYPFGEWINTRWRSLFLFRFRTTAFIHECDVFLGANPL